MEIKRFNFLKKQIEAKRFNFLKKQMEVKSNKWFKAGDRLDASWSEHSRQRFKHLKKRFYLFFKLEDANKAGFKTGSKYSKLPMT